MKKIGLILLAGFSLLVAPVLAQTDDPSEVFLKAYMTSQQGEKLERDNQFSAALLKFRSAGSLLDDLRKSHADWQPAIVEYRARKIGESILRVQGKAGTQAELAAIPVPADLSPTPVLSPPNASRAAPSIEIGSRPPRGEVRASVPAQPTPAPVIAVTPVAAPVTAAANEAAIKKATRDLQEKVDQLQTDLQKSRTQYSSVQKEKETLAEKLKETNSKLEQARSELQQTQGAEKAVRDQLAQAQDSLKKIQASGQSDRKATEALRDEIAQLKECARLGGKRARLRGEGKDRRDREVDRSQRADRERDAGTRPVGGRAQDREGSGRPRAGAGGGEFGFAKEAC